MRQHADAELPAFGAPERPKGVVPRQRRKTRGSEGSRSIQLDAASLPQALAFLRGRATVEIDLKNEPGEPGFDGTHRVAAEALRLVHELRLGPVILASSNPETMEWVRRHHPDAVTGVEVGAGEDLGYWIDYAAGQGHAFLMPDVAAVLSAGADFVARAHAHGVLVDGWTVNDPGTVSGLFSWGTDLVETDDPELAIPVRNRARIAGPGA